jgi:cytochrome P450
MQSNSSLMDLEVQECPWRLYQELRSEQPLYRDPKLGFYVLTRYEDVLTALRMPDKLSSKLGFRPGRTPDEARRIYEEEGFGEQVDTLVSNDPPSHTRFRALVDRAFSPQRVRGMESYIREIAHDLIDRLPIGSTFDIHEKYSIMLPLTVIADQLGVSRGDLLKFKEWSDASVARLGLMIGEEEQIIIAKKLVEMQRYFFDRLEERRLNPRDDMLSDLLTARVDGERPLNTEELLSIISQLLVAGNETTTSAISAGIMLLIDNPSQLETLRANEELYTNLAEEVLRIESPVQGLFRMATEDIEIAGALIPKGSIVNLRYGSANRDDQRFAAPDDFDVGRKGAGAHLAFGAGIHHCIGAQLARKEIAIGLKAIADRLAGLELVVPKNELRHFPSVILRGYTALPVKFSTKNAIRSG